MLHVASPSGRSRLAVETVDIGAGGARIIAPEAVGLDAEMHLEVVVPVRGAAVRLELPAVLRWTINLRETVLACRGYVHGLGFEGLTAGQLADLLRLVRDVGVGDRQVKRRARDRARA